MKFIMLRHSDQIHVAGEDVAINDQELSERAISVVADIVKRDPALIDCVSYGVRSRVSDMLKQSGVDFPPHSRNKINTDLPRSITSAAGEICSDLDLGGHLERVGIIGFHIASAMGLDTHVKNNVMLGGRLHDIGKLDPEMHRIVAFDGVPPPDQKPRIKLHPLIGARVAEYFRFPKNITDLVLNHHFRCDGTGYPIQNGAPMSIEIAALSVADAIDAMVRPRPGRTIKTLDQAFQAIQNGSGKHFHPDAVQALPRVAISAIYDRILT